MARKVVFNWVDGPHGEEVTVHVGGLRKTVRGDNAHFQAILDACEADDAELVSELLDKALAIKRFSEGHFEVVDGVVHIDGSPAEDALSDKIIKFMDRNLNYKPLVEFWRRLQKNPSYRSREQLFRFLEANNVPIVEDVVDGVDYTGCFVVWKSVRSDFLDHHSGTFDNTPGKVVSMERRDVNDDPNQTCSSGLHVAAWDYAWGFGCNSRYVKCYVDPANVVSVPVDYNNQKMRVCEYFVVEEVEPERAERERDELILGGHDDDDYEEDEDDDDDWDGCPDCGCAECQCYD